MNICVENFRYELHRNRHAPRVFGDDSRGNPTIEAEVILVDGTKACAVRAALRRAENEAVEIAMVHSSVLGKGSAKRSTTLTGRSANRGSDCLTDLSTDDDRAEGPRTSQNRSNASSQSRSQRRRGREIQECSSIATSATNAKTLPVPMRTSLNGGDHADNNGDSGFMVSRRCRVFAEALRTGAEIFHNSRVIRLGHSTGLVTKGLCPKLNRTKRPSRRY